MSDTKNASHRTYPAYKTSDVEWLGKGPEHWETATIRRYCRVFSGATPDRAIPNYWNGGTIPWIASGDVNLRRIVKAQQFITEAGYNASSTRYIRPGSVVLALAGQGRTKGMVATIECRTTCNQSLAAIEPSVELSNYNFLAYYLESRYEDIRALVGNGLRDGLNLEHIRGIQTPIPPLEEQAAIVRFLDHADEQIQRYIAGKERLITLLEEQRQALIHQAVTRGLDPRVKLKDSGVEWLGEVPAHWSLRTLGQLAESFRTGPFGSMLHQSDYIEGGTPVINPVHMRGGHIAEDPSCSVSEAVADRLSGYRLAPHDLIFSRRGELGRCALVRDRENAWLCGTGSIRVRIAFDEIEAEFLIRALQVQWVGEYLSVVSVGATMNNLNTGILKGVPVIVPPIQEQRQIFESIGQQAHAIDTAIARAQQQINLLQEYRTRLIADVVTGQLDVREAATQLQESS